MTKLKNPPPAGHYSFAYTPTFAGSTWTTSFAFNTNSSSTHTFTIDNISMCAANAVQPITSYSTDVLMHTDYYGFEAPTWGRRVGSARDMWEGTKNFSTRLIWPDGNINARIVPPIGRLQPKAIRDYFYPPNWQSASRETAMILETKSLGPLPTGNNDPDIIPSNNPSNVIIITPEASKSNLQVKKPID